MRINPPAPVALGAVVLFLFTLLASAAGEPADSAKAGLTTEDSLAQIELLNDGPHVFLESDSSVIVFYLCHGTIEKRQLLGTDTVTFSGFCQDSDIVYSIPMTRPTERPWEIDNVSRIFAVSDIQGEYRAFCDILVRGGVIDDSGHWTWGDGHLVVDGDVFDRGDRVTQCLWFIYRLQREARQAGGDVHFVLGNHELMVIRGDNRYVHARYLDGIARKSRIRYEDLFGADMVLGRWLRSLPTAVKLNNILFVHGGISPVALGHDLSLDALNRAVAEGLDLSSARVAFSDLEKFLFGSEGPLWYRGYHHAMEGGYSEAADDDIDRAMHYYGVGNIVVGHTEVDSIAALHKGRVLAIDVPVEEIGTLEGLLWQDGNFYRVNGAGELKLIK